jgi:hypothetical protein
MINKFIATTAYFKAPDDEVGLIELDENLSDAERPKDLPPGKYIGEVQSVQENQSGKGNTYYAIQFRVAPDEIPATVQDSFEDGALLFWNRIIKPRNKSDQRAKWNLRKFHEALGLDSNTSSIDPNDWMGREALLIVRTGRYQGEDRAEIQAVEAAEKKAPAREEKRGATRGKRK